MFVSISNFNTTNKQRGVFELEYLLGGLRNGKTYNTVYEVSATMEEWPLAKVGPSQ